MARTCPQAARSVVVVAVAMFLATACQPTVGAPASPAQVALQRRDVPKDLAPCLGSGSVSAYLKQLARQDPQGATTVRQGWAQLRHEGAADGAITIYAGQSVDCTRMPGSGAGRLASTLVARFDSEQAASDAYPKGAMGFPTPALAEEEPGLRQGISTQLSEQSWLLERQVGGHTLDVAYWQRGSYTVFFVSQDLHAVEVSRALRAVDGRAGGPGSGG